MSTDPLLNRAISLLHRGRYDEVLRLLEPEVVRFHDSFQYYYVLANACLRSADFGGALTYFRRAREIKMREPSVLVALAALHLRRGETDKAVELCLDAQDKDHGYRKASRALKAIRKHGDPESLATWIEKGNLKSIYPKLPKASPSVQKVLIVSTSVALVVCLGFILAVRLNLVHRAPGPMRSGQSRTLLAPSEKASPVEVGGSYRYILTKEQVLSSYEKAQQLFIDFRDDAARVEINRILDSNSAGPIKAKARLLADYAVIPGFDTLKDRYSFAQVLDDPLLYRGCHVIWKGMIANIEEGEKSTSFDLLVGYENKSALEGIVAVRFNIAIALDKERPLEVLGSIVPISGAGKATPFMIEGVAIHQSRTLPTKPDN